MDKGTLSTHGGAYIGGSVNTAGGPFAGRDSITINQFFSGLIPSLSRYAELVKSARDRLKRGEMPKLPSPASPLSYYEWIRPRPCMSLPTQEVEVWVTLISNVPQQIQVLEILPPEELTWTSPKFSRRMQIEPFGVLSAMRYIAMANTLRAEPTPPQVTYQIGRESTFFHTLSVLRREPEDIPGLFVPFVDRKELLKELEEYLKGIRSGKITHWLAIADEWGTGRSRALGECVRTAKQFGFEVLERKTNLTQSESVPCDPIRDAINQRLQFLTLGEDEALRLICWIEQGEALKQSNDCSIGLVAQYLNEGIGTDLHLRAVASAIVQRARTQPILIAIDDLHDAPFITSRLIHLLADQLSHVPEARLAVCVTYDPGECSPDLASCFRGRTVQLEGLGTEDVVKFVEHWFPEFEYPPDCQEPLLRFLGKRPLLIHQGLNYLCHTGHIRLAQGRWLLNSDFDRDLDEQRKHAVDEREGVGMLLQEYQELKQSEQCLIAKGLRIAAAIGVEFEYELWKQAMLDFEQCTLVQIRDVRDELIRREFIVTVPAEEGRQGTYRITPPILRRLIWQEIRDDGVLASELHGLIAQLLAGQPESDLVTSGRIAYQLLWGQEVSMMPEAFRRFCELALDSLERQHLDRTIALYKRALDAAEKSRGRISQDSIYRAWYALAEALDARGRWREAQDSASQLALNCKEANMHPLAAEAHILAGWVYQELGDVENAQCHYDQAGNLVHAHAMPEIEARLLRKQAAWYAEQGLVEKALECYQCAVQLPQSAEDLVQAQGSYAENLRRCGRLSEAREYMDKALRQCKRLTKSATSDLVVTRVNIQAGILCRTMGDLQNSCDHLEQALGLAQSIGALNEWAHADSWLGTVCSDIENQRPSDTTLQHYAQAADLFELLGNKERLAELIREYVPTLLLTGKYEAVMVISDRAAWLGVADSQLEEWRQIAKDALM